MNTTPYDHPMLRHSQDFYRLGRRLEAAGDFTDNQWTQGVLARNAAGEPAHPAPQLLDEDAKADFITPDQFPVAYCALGHIQRAAAEIGGHVELMKHCLHEILPQDGSIPDWNDSPFRTPQEVRDAFQQAANNQYQTALRLTNRDNPTKIQSQVNLKTPTAVSWPAHAKLLPNPRRGFTQGYKNSYRQSSRRKSDASQRNAHCQAVHRRPAQSGRP